MLHATKNEVVHYFPNLSISNQMPPSAEVVKLSLDITRGT